jgi:5-methylcytosine-specific restriction endonuclease McrA
MRGGFPLDLHLPGYYPIFAERLLHLGGLLFQCDRAQIKKWRIDNREKLNHLNNERRKRLREAGNDYRPPERHELGRRFFILSRDHFTCQYCGRKAPDVVLEIDHITPRSKGGTNATANLVTSCRACNNGKCDVLLQ